MRTSSIIAALWVAALTLTVIGSAWWAATLHPAAGLTAAGATGALALCVGIAWWPHDDTGDDEL